MYAYYVLAVLALVVAVYFRSIPAATAESTKCQSIPNRAAIIKALQSRNYSSTIVGTKRNNPATLKYSVFGAAGSKTAVRLLILQGLGSRGDMWARVGKDVISIASKSSNHSSGSVQVQCLVLDNRGAGLSSTQSTFALGRYTTRLMADDALELLDQLGWDHGIHVLGHSMVSETASE